MDAAELLRTVRARRGLTQVQLAHRAGTSQSVISAYEHGHRDPSVSTLRRLIEAGGERLVLSSSPPLTPPMTQFGDEAHGRRIVELLALADAIPTRRRSTHLNAPRIESR